MENNSLFDSKIVTDDCYGDYNLQAKDKNIWENLISESRATESKSIENLFYLLSNSSKRNKIIFSFTSNLNRNIYLDNFQLIFILIIAKNMQFSHCFNKWVMFYIISKLYIINLAMTKWSSNAMEVKEVRLLLFILSILKIYFILTQT